MLTILRILKIRIVVSGPLLLLEFPLTILPSPPFFWNNWNKGITSQDNHLFFKTKYFCPKCLSDMEIEHPFGRGENVRKITKETWNLRYKNKSVDPTNWLSKYITFVRPCIRALCNNVMKILWVSAKKVFFTLIVFVKQALPLPINKNKKMRWY